MIMISIILVMMDKLFFVEDDVVNDHDHDEYMHSCRVWHLCTYSQLEIQRHFYSQI